MVIFKELISKLFSDQCQLKSLRLDISSNYGNDGIHGCLNPNSSPSSNSIQHQDQPCCLTLRHLYIRLNHRCFLDNLFDRVPNLEEISLEFVNSLDSYVLRKSNVELLKQSNGNWFNKVREKPGIISYVYT